MILIFKLLVILLTLMYVALILIYVWGWHRLKTWQAPENKPLTSVCIIIPARNEAQYIKACLEAVLQQTFPKELTQIIVIDDHSDDETPDIVAKLAQKHTRLKLLKLADILPESDLLNAYKKKAITTAIAQTEQELIVTTDADCVMGKNWLSTLVGYYEKHRPQLMAAPVCFINETTFFQRFQTLDFFGMMVATGASAHFKVGNMCNGANLIYTRAAFHAVGGFKGIDDIASGDDMLLMHKISERYPDQICFVKSYDATVFSYPQANIRAFTSQRLRWASKTRKYDDKRITVYLAMVLFFNISIVINLVAGLLGHQALGQLFLFQFSLKCIVEFLFLGSGCHFFKRNQLLWLFLPAQIVHILYIIIIGIAGNFGTYTWKGRVVK